MTHPAEALLEEEQRHAAVLRAVRREELVLEQQLDRELRAIKAACRGRAEYDSPTGQA